MSAHTVSMAVKREVLETLISPSLLKVLKVFINHEDQTFYLREIAKLSRVPPASVYRIMQQLVESDIVLVEQVKKFKLYTFNTEHNRFLLDIFQDRKSAVAEFVRSVKAFDVKY